MAVDNGEWMANEERENRIKEDNKLATWVREKTYWYVYVRETKKDILINKGHNTVSTEKRRIIHDKRIKWIRAIETGDKLSAYLWDNKFK